MIVRPLEGKDIPACIHLGARMHEESDYRDMEYSPEKLVSLGRMSIVNDNHVWFVAEEAGEIVGLMGGYVTPVWFGDGTVALDHAVYVPPENRGGLAFIKLVKAFHSWAKEHGAHKMILSNSAAINSEKVEELFSRLGLEKTGVIFRGNI